MSRISICETCKQQFVTCLRNAGRFCSRACYNLRPVFVPQNRICETCGKEFLQRLASNAGRFCSQICSQAWRRDFGPCGKEHPGYKSIIVPCAYCGINLERSPRVIKDHKQAFCNREHFYAWMHEFGPRGEEHPHYNSVEVQCAYCQAPVMRVKYWAERNKRWFCNETCQYNWKREYGPRGEVHPRYKQVDVVCDHCGNSFRCQASKIGKQDHYFCSKPCMIDWRNAHPVVGEEHHCWRGGRSSTRGPNWYMQRNSARKRDNYHCQRCGKPEKELDRELDVHHIQPFRSFGYISGENENYLIANQLDNLVSLCRPCHNDVEWDTRYRLSDLDD